MNRKLGALLSVFALAVLAGILYNVRLRAEEAGLDTRLTAAEGEVDVKFKGEEEWTPAEADTPLEAGDAVKTGPASRAEISFGGQSIYELQENSDFTLAELSETKQAFDLSLGTLLLQIKKLVAGQSVEVRTKAALAAVVGTELGVSAEEGGITSVGVYEGTAIVEGQGVPGVPGRQFKVGKDKEIRLRFGIHPEDPGPLKSFLPWRARLKAMNARRIELRRDWRALPRAERLARRRQLAESRQQRRQERAERLGRRGEIRKEIKEKRAGRRHPARGRGRRR